MTKLDSDLEKYLTKLDNWLKVQQKTDLSNIIEASRVRITKIQEKGYYIDKERDFLNELRRQYIEDKKSNN